MIKGIGSGVNFNIKHNSNPPAEVKSDIKREELDEQFVKDCYKKQSDRDVPMLKGDRGPRLKHTYKRWDKDLQCWDVREKGSLPLLRRNKKAKNLAKTYREFAGFGIDVSLGTIRSIYGVIGLNAIRKAIRTKGIPKQFQK